MRACQTIYSEPASVPKQNYYFECFNYKGSDRIRTFKTRHEKKRYALKDKVLANPSTCKFKETIYIKYVTCVIA